MNDQLKKLFKTPPSEYAIYKMVHDIPQVHGLSVLEQLKDQGFGGIVTNIHYGPGYPDDSSDWNEFASNARKADSLGLNMWIYDEKGYPSGSAGGAVLDQRPDLETVGLTAFVYWRTLSGPSNYRSDTLSGKLFKALLVPIDGQGDPVDITHTADNRGVLCFNIPEGNYYMLVMVERELYDGTHSAHSFSEPRRYINLLDPDATDEFIDVTHNRYVEPVGEIFGKSIKAFFTDEPSLMNWNLENMPYPMVSWRHDFPEAFKQRYSYDIENALVALFMNMGPDVIKRRCDFWEYISTELADNFFGRIQEWCHANNLAASGHLLAEENIIDHVFLYGSYFASMRRFDIPGIDQLESEPSNLMITRNIPIARLAASVADILGLKEVMSEASDHCSRMEGRAIPINWLKASMNWHFALGVNVITSYFSFAGFTSDDMRSLNEYVARLGVMLRQGTRYSRVAVLYPECALWASCKPVPEARGGKQSEEAQAIGRVFTQISWGLLHRQIDFDYIDEALIRDSKIENGALTFGDRRYEAIILPHTQVLRSNTAEKIAEFTKSGGKVIALETLPKLSREGDSDETVRKAFANALADENGNLIVSDINGPDLTPEIVAHLPQTLRLIPDDSTARSLPQSSILAHTRRDGDTLIIFLANMTGMPYSATMEIDGVSCCEACDPTDGSVVGSPDFRVQLGAYQGMVYVARKG